MTLLSRKDLRGLTSSDHYNKYSFGLTPATIREYVGTPTIDEDGANTTTKVVEPYNDEWRLREDVYVVIFNESVSLDNSQLGRIYPHNNLIWAGATIYPKLVDPTDPNRETTAILKVNRSINLKMDVPIALMEIEEI